MMKKENKNKNNKNMKTKKEGVEKSGIMIIVGIMMILVATVGVVLSQSYFTSNFPQNSNNNPYYQSNLYTNQNPYYSTNPNYQTSPYSNTRYNSDYSRGYYDRYDSRFDDRYQNDYFSDRYSNGYYNTQRYDSGRDSRYYSTYNSGNYNNYNRNYGGFSGSYNPSFGSGGYSRNLNGQFNSPGYGGVGGGYGNNFNQGMCNNRQDFYLQVAPFSCTPAVVRSDLLEEQNVPVFCKIMGVQVNPLIDVSRIRSLSFSGEYPKGISGVSYYPARSAVYNPMNRYNEMATFARGYPLNDNLGYLVVVLSRYNTEDEMPDSVEANITANIFYESEGAYGVGQNYYYLTTMTDAEWQRDYRNYGFWNGKGYLRAEEVGPDFVTVGVYKDFNTRVDSVTVGRGQVSRDVYLDGYYCAAGLNLKLDELRAPRETALLQVDDEKMWVGVGDRFMENRCRVLSLDVYGGGGRIDISCSGSSGRFDLSLNPGLASIVKDGEVVPKDYSMGERINENLFLGYVGEDKEGNDFAVIVKDLFSNTESEFNQKDVSKVIESVVSTSNSNLGGLENEIEQRIRSNYAKLLRASNSDLDNKVDVEVLRPGRSVKFGLVLEGVSVIANKDWAMVSDQEKIAKDFYDMSTDKYEDLAKFYPNERSYLDEEDYYAAIGLYDAAKMSLFMDMRENAINYYDQLIRDFSKSKLSEVARHEKSLLVKYDTTNSRRVVQFNDRTFVIQLLDVKKPTVSDASAIILFDGKERTVGLNELITINDVSGSRSFAMKITEMQDDSIYYQVDNNATDINSNMRGQRLRIGDPQLINGINVRLTRINLNKQAKVTIVPRSFGNHAESDFHFKIGIEKRGIKLSPEQTEEMIRSLERSIKDLEEINAKLGEVVKAMKGACFATSALLNVKNFLSGYRGSSIARNDLMTGTGGWNEFCEKAVNDKLYSSIQECLLDKASDVESDVKILSDSIKQTNDQIKEIEDRVGVDKSDIFDVTGTVDRSKVEDEFKNEFENIMSSAEGEITLPDKEKTKVPFSEIAKWNASLTHEQRREIMTLYNAQQNGGSEVMKDMTDNKLGKTVLEAKNYHDYKTAQIKADKDANKNNLGITTINPAGDRITMGDIRKISTVDKNHPVYQHFEAGDNVIRVFVPVTKVFGTVKFNASPEVGGKEVIVKVKPDEFNKNYIPGETMYHVDGRQLSAEAVASVREYMSLAGIDKIQEADKKVYKNRIIDPDKLKVEYFERAPYKGLPAFVPVDVEEGWYVKMNYVLSGFGQPFDESGRVTNYYICNVGENGLVEFKQSSDDICRYYNEVNPVLDFPGLTQSESRVVVSKAQRAIQEASRQYGKERVTINGRSYESAISFGGDEGRCTDFMSARDCQVLFNVCDPVMCPASRCDLGGRFRVDNVIQTGVAGSLILCLPNYKEGVMIPICLSGVHAGLEGYISILRSARDCLNESLETGRNVGICDEIKSIYICEFFWKQAIPILKVAIPRLFESLYGGGTRGGGEYTTVSGAWDNMQSSIDYFRNDYAVSSMEAFNQRSYNNIGSEGDFCRMFISSGNGDLSNFFEQLIEPDVPAQYHAWFSENPMTTATVPPTSHYKVYYHIYAGKDIGSYYVVYLRDPDLNTGYVYRNPVYTVDRGYVSRGEEVDRTRDFTATSGYKQLCINVNGRDECGFGQVTTSYALNYLSDQYVADQMENQIKSEEECVAGSPSVYSLANPNLQAGVENVLNPAIYNKGIVRVCASENPGKTVDASGEYDSTARSYDRWKAVGYCGDPTIKCWLDTESVQDIVRDTQLEEQILGQVDLNNLGQGGYLEEGMSMSILNEISNQIDEIDADILGQGYSLNSINAMIRPMVQELERVEATAINNKHRARALYLHGRLYSKIAMILYNDFYIKSDGQTIVDSSSNILSAGDGVDGVVPDGTVDGDGIIQDGTGGEVIPGDVVDSSNQEFIPLKETVFLFNDGASYNDYYYKYEPGNGWYFAKEGARFTGIGSPGDWISVHTTKLDEISDLNNNEKAFITLLKGKFFAEGLVELARRTVNNNEGGLFFNTKLIVLVGEGVGEGKTEEILQEYKYFDNRIIPPDKIVEEVLNVAGRKPINKLINFGASRSSGRSGSSATGGVIESDIIITQGTGGIEMKSINVYINGNLETVIINSFDEASQIIVTANGETRKLAKDSQGRIIYVN